MDCRDMAIRLISPYTPNTDRYSPLINLYRVNEFTHNHATSGSTVDFVTFGATDGPGGGTSNPGGDPYWVYSPSGKLVTFPPFLAGFKLKIDYSLYVSFTTDALASFALAFELLTSGDSVIESHNIVGSSIILHSLPERLQTGIIEFNTLPAPGDWIGLSLRSLSAWAQSSSATVRLIKMDIHLRF